MQYGFYITGVDSVGLTRNGFNKDLNLLRLFVWNNKRSHNHVSRKLHTCLLPSKMSD